MQLRHGARCLVELPQLLHHDLVRINFFVCAAALPVHRIQPRSHVSDTLPAPAAAKSGHELPGTDPVLEMRVGTGQGGSVLAVPPCTAAARHPGAEEGHPPIWGEATPEGAQ